jgi:DNA-directed RNA polymerase subunit omega
VRELASAALYYPYCDISQRPARYDNLNLLPGQRLLFSWNWRSSTVCREATRIQDRGRGHKRCTRFFSATRYLTTLGMFRIAHRWAGATSAPAGIQCQGLYPTHIPPCGGAATALVDHGIRRGFCPFHHSGAELYMLDELKEEGIVNKVGGRFKLARLIQMRMVALYTGAKPLVDLRTTDKMAIVVQEILRDKIYLDMSGNVQTREGAVDVAGSAAMFEQGDASGGDD